MRAARRIRLDLAYDGTDFAGWQVQRGDRTVQGELEQVLTELQGGDPVTLRGAGRTDSGVHASHQVSDCAIRCRLDDPALEHALRRMLPSDLRPLRVVTVSPDFHSRKHALFKTYRYRVDISRHGDPFMARYSLHYPHALDLGLVQRGLDLLPGRRDWTGFAASSCDKVDRVRNLTVARLDRPTRDGLCFTFTADGFLQYMVRNLVGTLLYIGGRRLPLETIEEMLSAGDRSLGAPTAAARGLCLTRVHYSGEDKAP